MLLTKKLQDKLHETLPSVTLPLQATFVDILLTPCGELGGTNPLPPQHPLREGGGHLDMIIICTPSVEKHFSDGLYLVIRSFNEVR